MTGLLVGCRARIAATLISAVAVAMLAPAAPAATYPSGFSERTLVGGLDNPVGVAWTPDGRMLVIEQAGKLKIVQPGGSTASTILDITTRVHSYGDRGLLGLAVDSSFETNRFIYLLWTVETRPLMPDQNFPMVSRLSRYTLNPDNTLGPEVVILGSFGGGPCPAPSNTVDCIPSDRDSHSIGSVRSAPDGTLYVGSGDGADYNTVDPLAFRTYNEQSMAGKIMHIDRDGRGLVGHAFCPTNGNLDQVCTKIHTKGLRNPYRFKIAADGRLTVGDVGWTTWEEVDLIGSAGKSMGWPCYEGNHRRPGYSDRPECPPEYAKEGTPERARGAGPRVRPQRRQRGDRRADLPGHRLPGRATAGRSSSATTPPASCAAWYWTGKAASSPSRTSRTTSSAPSTSRPHPARATSSTSSSEPGAREPAQSQEVRYTTGNTAPTAQVAATPDAGQAPLNVSFSSVGTGDPDGDTLAYDWDFGDGTPHSTQPNPTHVL